MRRTLLLLCVFSGVAAAQPTQYGPWPQLGIPDPPAAVGAAAYRLTPSENGPILSYMQGGRRTIELRWVRLTEEGWGEPVVVAEDGKMLANFADVPAVVEGGDGAMYAHWLYPTNTKASAYDIRVMRSVDAGATWSELGVLNDDEGHVAEHGFVSYVPDPAGVRAYWLDGRNMNEGEHGFVSGFMSLRTALVGETIGASELLDERVCDCCTTGAVLTGAGPLVVYRDRTEDEVRDISLVGGSMGGPTVLREDGWVIPGCPVNGPAIAGEGERVATVWFTAADQNVRIYAAMSSDSGATFGEPIVIDESDGQHSPVGRVDVVLDGEEAIVSWQANDRRRGSLLLQRINSSGKVGEPRVLALMDTDRKGGFPQMELLGDSVVVVWRDVATESLRAAKLGLDYIGR